MHRGLFHGPSRVHHEDPVGDVRHHPQIMGDEHDGGAEAFPQGLQDLEDARLDGDVEGGRRLVGDEHGRVAGDADGDHYALPHAAAELVRVLVDALPGRRDAHQVQEFDGTRACLLLRQALVAA
ncbi:hypothetical protein STSP_60070 [Streptomyces jeddahensis]|uniref:Uncharacterized protein n=1 Tax=Streptomyces jeddahensis TaxID=1716141 RepID=A0A177HIE9_9ACTN|nr:hypothetical protein STSP_60070 [Streptomyces jeddahensis]